MDVSSTAQEQQAASWTGGMTPLPFAVRSARHEPDDIVTLELVSLDGAPFPFLPGQFTMMYVHGVGEIPVSISGDPADPATLVQTIRPVGAVSTALWRMRAGDRVGIRGPFGRGWPAEAAHDRHLLVVAGGVGMAPTRPIVYWALANKHRLKSITVLYGARTPDLVLYPMQLLGWRINEDVTVEVTVDLHSRDWSGPVGVVTDLIKRLKTPADDTVAMVCGPEVMMRFATQALTAWGVAESDIYVSMERSMKCGAGWCGHCQLGPHLICRDGPVFSVPEVRRLMSVWEL